MNDVSQLINQQNTSTTDGYWHHSTSNTITNTLDGTLAFTIATCPSFLSGTIDPIFGISSWQKYGQQNEYGTDTQNWRRFQAAAVCRSYGGGNFLSGVVSDKPGIMRIE
jgi:hypothetical protein